MREMSGHAARSGEGGQAVLERIQVSVLPITGKHALTPVVTSMEKQDVNVTVKECIQRAIFINI